MMPDDNARDLNSRIDTKADKTSTLSLLNQHDQTMQEIARLRGTRPASLKDLLVDAFGRLP